jgi:hypothetical protein
VPATSRPWGPSGVLRLAADDRSTVGVGSPRVPACRLVPGLLLGDRSLCGTLLKTGVPLILFPFISQPFGCSSFSPIYLHREKSLLGPSSKAFRRVLSILFELCRCTPERSACVACSGRSVSSVSLAFSSRSLSSRKED